MREPILAHYQGREPKGEGIHTRPGLCVGALVGPYNVEARVDAGYRKAVEGGVAEGQRREIIRVGELYGRLACTRACASVDACFQQAWSSPDV